MVCELSIKGLPGVQISFMFVEVAEPLVSSLAVAGPYVRHDGDGRQSEVDRRENEKWARPMAPPTLIVSAAFLRAAVSGCAGDPLYR